MTDFDMSENRKSAPVSCELKLEARKDNLDRVIEVLDDVLDRTGCPMKARMQLEVAVEEIFINIASYAYGTDTGMAEIRMWTEEAPEAFLVSFADSGIPYDPMKKEDPDVSLPASEREIGGLGIYLVKKSMDDVTYRYEDGKNILTLKKKL